MRILAVNPNTSTAVTDAFVTEARRIAPPDVSVDGVTGTFGATIVSCEAENVVAAHSALDLLAAHAAGYDAVILAISFDSGLLAAQELLPVPVVGLTHAACRAAGVEDRPVGVIGFGAVSLPLYRRTIHGHGFRPVAFEAVEIASTAAYLTPGAMDRAVLGAVDRLAAAGAEAQDWEGGTRIGDCLRSFNRDWSRRVMGQGAVVLLITDGLDRDDPGALAREMERLHLSARRLIWLNPLLRWDGFAPKARGIAAMLPHVDSFRAGHSVASLEDLAAVISRPDDLGEKARLMAMLER